ncbi:hypothetical protein F4560_008093 [Saccharothrix ecbatanensis]|uniref:Uncharacterized protein n=2 Tax=Saccharothrix ecbatanensis TaxID=1105145 RepID=A0A7W9HU78_9PSEU|nr:hypothetical protein [Saccharothrix ecbatanensis]
MTSTKRDLAAENAFSSNSKDIIVVVDATQVGGNSDQKNIVKYQGFNLNQNASEKIDPVVTALFLVEGSQEVHVFEAAPVDMQGTQVHAPVPPQVRGTGITWLEDDMGNRSNVIRVLDDWPASEMADTVRTGRPAVRLVRPRRTATGRCRAMPDRDEGVRRSGRNPFTTTSGGSAGGSDRVRGCAGVRGLDSH